MPHEIFVGIARNIILFRPMLREVEGRVFKDADQVAEAFDSGSPFAWFVRVIEIREVAASQSAVGINQRLNDLRVDLVADVILAFQGDHIFETGPLWNDNRGLEAIVVGVLVGNVFDEQHKQDVVLVLAGIHAATQFITGRPQGGIAIRFLDGHE